MSPSGAQSQGGLSGRAVLCRPSAGPTAAPPAGRFEAALLREDPGDPPVSQYREGGPCE